ncbi:MAG: adenylate/guanylate cyclase domain-containing protein [Gammaproteobacteria bacterium]|nr:adenylate/guanylate cyclase domain-containing protein [Gammaproteobacteria bacterium]MCZ6912742.1 adenylate/guanylate cyclase domain-containing protein [Pseudomonadota bacterium]
MGKEIELAILFADVVGSTRLYESLGDVRARDTVGHCIDVMRQATENNSGTVIKTMGDEVMSSFPTADDALNAGSQMQKSISDNPDFAGGEAEVTIRVGCHYGPVVLENRDIFGAAVHTANRMTSQAKPSQIITTQVLVGKLSEDWKDSVRQIDIAAARGQSEEIVLYEVLWQTEDLTSMLPVIDLNRYANQKLGRLTLRCQDREVAVDSEQTTVTIGRGENSDLIVKGTLISRLHARIELERNKFLLYDQSTNGTFVYNDGKESFLRRDDVQLTGKGYLGLGKAVTEDSPLAIHFVIKEK